MDQLPYTPETIKVMVVDGHDLIRKAIAKVLRKMRFEMIFECSNGVEAKRVLTSQVIDLAVCDIYLPGANGFQVLQFIRGSDYNCDIPFLIVTGESSKDDIVKASDLGADEYMLKPFQADELEKKVTKMLTKYHSPTPLLFYIRQAERLMLKGSFGEALSSVDKGLEVDQASSRALHLKAILYDKMGKNAEAIELLKLNIDKNQSFYKNYQTLADVYLKLGNAPEAIRAMRSELDLNPKQAQRQVQLSQLLTDSGDYQGAIEHLRLALLENPKMKAALFGMGRAFAEANKLDKAIYYFKRLRRHHPNATPALEAIVKYSLAAHSPKHAEMALKDEKKSNPGRIDTYFVMAKYFAATERPEEGLVAIEEALRIDPESEEAMGIKANLCVRMGQVDEAITLYREMIKRKPEVGLYIKLSEILIMKNNHSEAMSVLHKALQFNAQTPLVLSLLADSVFKTNQYAKAYFAFARLSQLGSRDQKLVDSINKSKEMITLRRRQIRNIAS